MKFLVSIYLEYFKDFSSVLAKKPTVITSLALYLRMDLSDLSTQGAYILAQTAWFSLHNNHCSFYVAFVNSHSLSSQICRGRKITVKLRKLNKEKKTYVFVNEQRVMFLLF